MNAAFPFEMDKKSTKIFDLELKTMHTSLHYFIATVIKLIVCFLIILSVICSTAVFKPNINAEGGEHEGGEK